MGSSSGSACLEAFGLEREPRGRRRRTTRKSSAACRELVGDAAAAKTHAALSPPSIHRAAGSSLTIRSACAHRRYGALAITLAGSRHGRDLRSVALSRTLPLVSSRHWRESAGLRGSTMFCTSGAFEERVTIQDDFHERISLFVLDQEIQLSSHRSSQAVWIA